MSNINKCDVQQKVKLLRPDPPMITENYYVTELRVEDQECKYISIYCGHSR